MCDKHLEHITVYNLNTNTFRPKFLGHLKSPYEDVPGDIIWEHHVANLAILPDETGLAYTLRHRKHVDAVCEVVFADFDGNRLRNIPGKWRRETVIQS